MIRLCLTLVGVTILALPLVSACRQGDSALSRIQESGILRVAVDPSFPPFESVDSAGQVVGYDADLGQALARHLDADVHFVTTGYDALYDTLTVGRADVIISALYPDQSRTSAFVFSDPYFNAGEVIIVSAESEIVSSDDLAGQRIACVFGTAGHMELLRLGKTLTPPPTVLTVDDPVTITAALHTGTVEAIVIDHVSALTAAGSDPGLDILLPPLTDEPYVIAARQEDSRLLRALNEALSDLAANDTLDALRDRWMVRPTAR